MHGKDEKCIHSENLKVRDHSGDLGIERRIILERILREMWCEDVDWIHLARDRGQLRAAEAAGSIKGGEFLD
jgi:hypothetical protein